MKYKKWLEELIKNTERDLLAKTRSATIDQIRYLSGQLDSLHTAYTIYEQLRKEGNQDA